MRDSEIRRNRKHLFVLGHHQNEEPRSSPASLRFGKSTCYSMLPVDSSTKLNPETHFASHFRTSDSEDISSSDPGGV